MSTVTKIDSIIDRIETKLASLRLKRSELTFFPIDEIEADTLNENHINYYFKSIHKPVVIRGGASHFDAIQKWKISDNFKYLISKCGNDNVYIRRETNSFKYRNGQKYKIEAMKFKQYLNGIINNTPKSQSSYLAVTNIRYKLNNIINDVPLCLFENNSKPRARTFKLFRNNNFKFKLHSGPHLWIAQNNHYEFCHFDLDDSILCMIKGTKKVRIFPPKFLNGMHCNKMGTKGRTIQSQIDFDNDNIQNFNEFIKYNVFGYVVELNVGDILLIPAFWMHQVTSLTKSISINYFCGDYYGHFPSRIFRNNYNCLKFWLLNIIEQNRNYEQFLSVIGNLEKSIYNTFYKQWHDLLSDQQVNKLTNAVIEYLMDENVRHENDIYYKYGDLRIKSNRPKIKKNNPFIKIRGLLYRDD
eukprot:544365_1